MCEDALCEFHADWAGAGKSLATANFYRLLLIKLHQEIDTISYRTVADWIQAASGRPMQRKRAQAVRAFGKWSASVDEDARDHPRSSAYRDQRVDAVSRTALKRG